MNYTQFKELASQKRGPVSEVERLIIYNFLVVRNTEDLLVRKDSLLKDKDLSKIEKTELEIISQILWNRQR